MYVESNLDTKKVSIRLEAIHTWCNSGFERDEMPRNRKNEVTKKSKNPMVVIPNVNVNTLILAVKFDIKIKGSAFCVL